LASTKPTTGSTLRGGGFLISLMLEDAQAASGIIVAVARGRILLKSIRIKELSIHRHEK
jgi:hypothetical protein